MLPLIAFFVLATVAMAFIVYFLSTRAIMFAKGVIALCLSLMLSNAYSFVPDSGFLNFIAWAIICFGVLYLLALLPRADMAIRFFCTFFVSIITTEIVAMFIGLVGDVNFTISLPHEIVNRVISLGLAVFSVASNRAYKSASSPRLLIRLLDRLMASVMYTISSIFLLVSLHGHWDAPPVVDGIVLLSVFVGTFVADIFLAKKYLFE